MKSRFVPPIFCLFYPHDCTAENVQVFAGALTGMANCNEEELIFCAWVDSHSDFKPVSKLRFSGKYSIFIRNLVPRAFPLFSDDLSTTGFVSLRSKRLVWGLGAKKDPGTRFLVFCPREKWEPKNEKPTLHFSGGQNAENPVPLTFFARQPHGNACYAG